MCGIVGFIGFKGDSSTLLSKMVGAIVHRGPDDEGILISEGIGIGMRRLAIIDVAHGKQPVTSSDGILSIVFNGEIYNYQEIRQELENLGRVFRTQSDTETILIGYQQWGADILLRLRGMFAFAIYNHNENSLFIARDRMGIKPLYYAQRNGEFVFGSEIKSLLHHPIVRRDVNSVAVDDYLSLRYVPGPSTLFQDIKKFPPAHFVHLKNGEGNFKRYWSPSDIPPFSRSKVESQDQFDKIFDAVTKSHMISERPVGAFLSGGLDSTAIVTSLAAQFPSQKLKTFSVGFGWEGDELSAAAATAKDLGCDHHEIICKNSDSALLGKIVHSLDEPIGDGIVLPMYLLSKLASEHVKVVQSGEGADEIFGGYFIHRIMKWAELYSRYIPTLLQKGMIMPMVKAMPPAILNHAFDYPGDLGEAGKSRLLEFLSVLGGQSTSAQYRFIISLFSENDKEKFYTPSFQADVRAHAPMRAETTILDFNRMLELQFEHWLPDDILTKLDKIGMAHSIEGRVPFMDHKLVEFALSLPESHKIEIMRNKIPVRGYLARHRNASMAKRKKMPFYIPINQYLTAEPLKGMVEELLSERSVRQRGLFRPEAMKDLRQAADQPGFLFGKQLFSLAMLELWYRIFIDEEKGWI